MADDKKKNPEKKTGTIPKLLKKVLRSPPIKDDETAIINTDTTSEINDDESRKTKKETGAISKQLKEEPMPSTTAQLSASKSNEDELLQKATANLRSTKISSDDGTLRGGSFRRSLARRSIKTLRLLSIIPPEPIKLIENLVTDEIELFGSCPNSPPDTDTPEPTLSSIDVDMKLSSFNSLEMLSVTLSDPLPEPLSEPLSQAPSEPLLETMGSSFEPIELSEPDYVEANKLPVFKFKAELKTNEDEYNSLTIVKFNHSGPLYEPGLSYLAVICKNRIKIYDVPVKDSKFKIRLDHKEAMNEYVTCDWSYVKLTDGDSKDIIRAPRLAVGGKCDKGGGVVTILNVKGTNFYKESPWLKFKDYVKQVLFHVRDNHLLFVANKDCISLWHIDHRKCVCVISNSRINSIDINTAGAYLATATGSEIKVWNVDLGDAFMRTQIEKSLGREASPIKERYTLMDPVCIQNRHNYLVDSVKWYLNTIISKDINGILLFWQLNDLGVDAYNYNIIMKIELNNCSYKTNLDAIYNERTNRYLAVGNRNGVINVWDLNSKVFDRIIKYEIVVPDCDLPIISTTISSCGNVLVAAAIDGTLYCWNHRHRYIFNLYNY